MTDIEHFEVFMRNYQDMVYSTAVRLLGNETDAQDIAQTVFIKAYDFYASLAQSKTAGGWLKTVTTNLCLNHLTRYRARWRFFSELKRNEEDADFLESVAAPDTMTPGLDDSDDRVLLEAALHKLPEAQRVPLVLYHFEDLDYEEIARRLSVSLSKVKTDIHRGRLSLKRFLSAGFAGDERFSSGPAPT
jgi:RNA polymerase sigma-70 factor (ECF subfamily)